MSRANTDSGAANEHAVTKCRRQKSLNPRGPLGRVSSPALSTINTRQACTGARQSLWPVRHDYLFSSLSSANTVRHIFPHRTRRARSQGGCAHGFPRNFTAPFCILRRERRLKLTALHVPAKIDANIKTDFRAPRRFEWFPRPKWKCNVVPGA